MTFRATRSGTFHAANGSGVKKLESMSRHPVVLADDRPVISDSYHCSDAYGSMTKTPMTLPFGNARSGISLFKTSSYDGALHGHIKEVALVLAKGILTR